MPTSQLLFLTILTEGSLVLIGSILAWLFGVPVWSKISLAGPGLFMGIIGGLILAIIAVLLLKSSSRLFSQLRYDTRQVAGLLSRLDIFSLLLVSFLAGFCEEFLFRGVLQVVISDWYGIAAGILVSAILFGLIHPISASYIFYVTIFGVLIGWMFYRTDSLVMAMTAHAVYDFIMLVWVLKFNRSSFID